MMGPNLVRHHGDPGHIVAFVRLMFAQQARDQIRQGEGLRSKQEMVIGRTDEQQNPFESTADTCRNCVWMSFAEPIWASGHATASKAGHMTAFEPISNSAKTYLNPKGRPHMIQGGGWVGGQYLWGGR